VKVFTMDYSEGPVKSVIENLRNSSSEFSFIPKEQTPEWLVDVAAFVSGMNPVLQDLDHIQLSAFLLVLCKMAKENPGCLYVFTGAACIIQEVKEFPPCT
jgi:hypothetical protein